MEAHRYSQPTAPERADVSCKPISANPPSVSQSASTIPRGTGPRQQSFLDINRPLFPQLLNASFSKETYLAQVHRPRYYRNPENGQPGSAQLFGNTFLELLSKTPWYAVPIIWLPLIVSAFFYSGSKLAGYTLRSSVPNYESVGWRETWLFATILWAAGLAAWTLIEYVLHRGLFHVDSILPEHPYAFTAHFVLHGIHHYMPMDQLRLVMPPVMTLCIATPFWFLTRQLIRSVFQLTARSPYGFPLSGATILVHDEIAKLVFSGVMTGYVMYDLTHYFLHHMKLPGYYHSLKRYHLQHHFQDFHNGFGVSNRFWDRVFGTELHMPPTGRTSKKTVKEGAEDNGKL